MYCTGGGTTGAGAGAGGAVYCTVGTGGAVYCTVGTGGATGAVMVGTGGTGTGIGIGVGAGGATVGEEGGTDRMGASEMELPLGGRAGSGSAGAVVPTPKIA